MAKALDISGKRFGRLTAISRTAVKRKNSPGTASIWRCVCDCGNVTATALSSLRQGSARSCGCLKAEITAARSTKHGHSPEGAPSDTYNSWRGMVDRCSNKSNKAYSYYGGRGISVCKRWRKFKNFLADMGVRPRGKTIDRRNTNGNYKPSNCLWSTMKQQANNRRARRTKAELCLRPSL